METNELLEIQYPEPKWDLDKEIEGSSQIKHLKHYAKGKLLWVTFHRGGTYQYEGVTRTVVNRLLRAPSLGHEFVQSVKFNFRCTKVRAT